MTPLEQKLNYDKAYRKNRFEAAQWVLKNPKTISQLIHYIYHPLQNDQSHKAAWVLEFVVVEDLSQLFPHLDLFFNNITFPKKESTVRPLAHICERLCLAYYKKQNKTLLPLFTNQHKEIMVEVCFDWMITDKKVACTARAMTALYHLGSEIDWIHAELKILLQQKIPQGSAGYKNRAKKILALLNNET